MPGDKPSSMLLLPYRREVARLLYLPLARLCRNKLLLSREQLATFSLSRSGLSLQVLEPLANGDIFRTSLEVVFLLRW